MGLYSTHTWRDTRSLVLNRDGNRCTVARLFGGVCVQPLHVHHIVPVADGGDEFDPENLATVCAAHHPIWEALRRRVVERLIAPAPRCQHQHRTAEARRICEARMARRVAA